MNVNFVKSHPKAVTPTYAREGDAGLDLTAVSKEDLGNGLFRYGFGLKFEIPKGYAGFIYPRSSVYKKGQSLTNCVGVIDSGYRGEISAVFKEDSSQDGLLCKNSYEIGERVAQIIIQKVDYINLIPVQRLQDSERGTGGYGSTGN